MAAVDLVINCYERTYRAVLSPGFFPSIVAQNRRAFAGAYAVINNVDDRREATKRADALIADGELSGYTFVADRLEDGLRVARLPRRALGPRPYFLDYALVMALTGESPFVLGWDAEVRLEEPVDWVTPSVDLLERRADVFSTSPRWPARAFDTLDEETVGADGPWRLNWGFSDQSWVVRRSELASPIYRAFAPAAWARQPDHPFTFEGRVEAYQRAARRYRATHSQAHYTHNDLTPVIDRLGRRSFEDLRSRQLQRLNRLLRRLGSTHPRLRLP